MRSYFLEKIIKLNPYSFTPLKTRTLSLTHISIIAYLHIIINYIIIYIIYSYGTEIKTFNVSMRTKKKSKSPNEKIEIPACAPRYVIRIPFYRGENKTLATRVKNGVGPHNNNNGIGCYNNNIVAQVNSVIIF